MIKPLQLFNDYYDWFTIIWVLDVVACSLIMFFLLKVFLNDFKYSFIFSIVYVPTMTLVGFIGASIFAAFEDYISNLGQSKYEHDINLSFILEAHWGANFLGGLFSCSILLYLIYRKLNKELFLTFLDITAITCSFAYGFGRLGCHLSGDGCNGVWTNLPWGVHYTYGVHRYLLPVHPTAVYEMIINLSFFFILIYILSKKSSPGFALVLFLYLFSASRFIIEFIRVNPRILFSLTQAQLISIFNIGVASILFKKLNLSFTDIKTTIYE